MAPFCGRDGGGDVGFLDREIIDYHSHKAPDPEDRDDEYWTLTRPHESWAIWRLLEATRNPWTGQYSFMPFRGGLLDQPEWLIHDLTMISEYDSMIREQMKPGIGKGTEWD